MYIYIYICTKDASMSVPLCRGLYEPPRLVCMKLGKQRCFVCIYTYIYIYIYINIYMGDCLKERLRILYKVVIIIFGACFLLFGMRRGPRLGK